MANTNLTQYDPGLVVVSVDGNNISGYADGSFVDCEREVDAYSKQVGADGETTRIKSQNFSGTVKITLQQGSPSNDILSTLADKDEATSNAVFIILVKDAGGTTLMNGAKAWIKKKPPVSFGKEAATREWSIDVANMIYTVGGGNLL